MYNGWKSGCLIENWGRGGINACSSDWKEGTCGAPWTALVHYLYPWPGGRRTVRFPNLLMIEKICGRASSDKVCDFATGLQID